MCPHNPNLSYETLSSHFLTRRCAGQDSLVGMFGAMVRSVNPKPQNLQLKT